MITLYLTRLTLPAKPAERHRALSAGAHRLLAYGLTQAGYPTGQWTLCRTAEGKPYLTDGDGSPAKLKLSLSHSGEWAACALSDAPIGVDLERIRPVSPSLWKHYLAASPHEPVGDGYTAILRWTRYEAALKRDGHPPEAVPPETSFRTLRCIPGYLLTVIGEGTIEAVRFVSERALVKVSPI